MDTFKKITNRILTLVLALLLVIENIHPFNAQALMEKEKEKISIIQSFSLIKDSFEYTQEKLLNELKKEILNEKYDYYTSLYSFEKERNEITYTDNDLLNIIAAYIYLKDIKDLKLYGLPLIKNDLKEVKGESGDKNYLESSLSLISQEEMFELFGAEYTTEAKANIRDKKVKLERILEGDNVAESIFVKIPNFLLDKETQEYLSNLLISDITDDQYKVAGTAISLISRVPYEWGGKADKAGYDNLWWTFNSNGKQRGLDCSGYVQWVYMTAGYGKDIYGKIGSTSSILKNTEEIREDELKVGDLGLINHGEKVNHVGIYMGDGYWAHCSSGKGTVVVEKTSMFIIYRRVPVQEDIELKNEDYVSVDKEKIEEVMNLIPTEDEIESIELMPEENKTEEQTLIVEEVNKPEDVRINITEYVQLAGYSSELSFTKDDVYLLAQLVCNEANAEGLNGWIAVAEVVKNRILSEDFPNSIYDVIYQPSQFSNNENIKARIPTDEMIKVVEEVLKGNMSILNNENCLYFRNNGGDTANWGQLPYYMTINHHQFYLKKG